MKKLLVPKAMSFYLGICFLSPLFFSNGMNASASTKRPNFILFLADDQDVLLGGFGLGTGQPLPHAIPALRKHGTIVTHWFAHTPVCCPSRAEILTGRMFHNLQRRPTDRWDTDGHGHPKQCMHINESALSPGSILFYFILFYIKLFYISL